MKNELLGAYRTNVGIINEINYKIEQQEKCIKERQLVIKERQSLVDSESLKVHQLDVELKEINNVINTKKRKLDHKKQLLEQVQRESAVLVGEVKKDSEKVEVKISKCVTKKRKRKPTDSTLNRKAKEIR